MIKASLTFEKAFVLFILILLVTCTSRVTLLSLHEDSIRRLHEQWMVQYGRTYKDQAEKEMRFKIFKDNVEYIESVNKDGKRSYKLGPNEFADLTNEEFRNSRNGYKRRSKSSGTTPFRYENVTDVPTSIDWRDKGAVTHIKNQGQCAVAAVEGINKVKTGNLTSLSEQEFVDCDVNGDDAGCERGLMDDAFKFIIENKGLASEDNYPYQGVDGTCNKSAAAFNAAQINGYEDVPMNNESALLKAEANQPVSVAIDAGGTDFQFYSSGVFTGECGTALTHGVTVVGCEATNNGTKYWIVKNSWGTSWGEKGYIKMLRDVVAKQGLCGIAMDASHPTAQ